MHGAKELAGITASPQQLDEVGQAAPLAAFPGQKQPLSLLTISERGASILFWRPGTAALRNA